MAIVGFHNAVNSSTYMTYTNWKYERSWIQGLLNLESAIEFFFQIWGSPVELGHIFRFFP